MFGCQSGENSGHCGKEEVPALPLGRHLLRPLPPGSQVLPVDRVLTWASGPGLQDERAAPWPVWGKGGVALAQEGWAPGRISWPGRCPHLSVPPQLRSVHKRCCPQLGAGWVDRGVGLLPGAEIKHPQGNPGLRWLLRGARGASQCPEALARKQSHPGSLLGRRPCAKGTRTLVEDGIAACSGPRGSSRDLSEPPFLPGRVMVALRVGGGGS